MRKRIYVAGPISQGNTTENVARATRVGRELIRRGFAPLIPQLSCFMGYNTNVPGGYVHPHAGAGNISHEDWIATDLPWVAVADAVLRLPGASKGADAETQCAEENGIPVFAGATDDLGVEAVCSYFAQYAVAEWATELSANATRLLNGLDPVGEPTISHRTFDTGSVRDSRTGKGRFDLLPPAALRRLAQHFERGAEKYGDHNWRKGQPLQSYIDSALRHICNHQEGMRDEDHLIAAVWNLLAHVETEHRVEAGKLPESLDDFPYEHVGGAA